MTTGAAAVSGRITTSRITGARAANSNVSGTAAAVITANRPGADTVAGITANLTALTITTVMNTANARASLIISEAMKANIASLITAAGAGAARSEASSSARATRSSPGSETRRPSGGGGRTRYVRGCMRGAARAVT